MKTQTKLIPVQLPHHRQASVLTSGARAATRALAALRQKRFIRQGSALVAALLWMTSALCLQATVLDNFNGATMAGWTDTLNGGTVVQGGGVFTVTTATGNGALAFSRKTSANFANADKHTIDLRVDVNTVTPGNPDPNALAILGWVPTGGALLVNGYSVSVGYEDLIIQKGATVLYATNFVAAGR